MTLLSNVELDRLAIEADARQGEQLTGRVHEFLGRFVAFPSREAHVAVTLWVIHAHLMDRWESTPRLAFLSAEPASGKTRALEILELLVPRPILPVNASPSYLFTCVASEDGLPTVLFDEIDTVFGPKAKDSNEDVRGFLNAGHRKGAVFGRAVYLGNGKRRAEELPAYCAVALAGLGWLPDTILSRSVIIRMRRSPWHDLRGKPLDERGLAHRLRQYDIKSKNIRTDGSVSKGYARGDFQDVWDRYLPPHTPPEKSATSVTGVTTSKNQRVEVDDMPPRVADVADVAQFPRSVSAPKCCAQCQGADDGKLHRYGEVWLHKECKQFFFGER